MEEEELDWMTDDDLRDLLIRLIINFFTAVFPSTFVHTFIRRHYSSEISKQLQTDVLFPETYASGREQVEPIYMDILSREI